MPGKNSPGSAPDPNQRAHRNTDAKRRGGERSKGSAILRPNAVAVAVYEDRVGHPERRAAARPDTVRLVPASREDDVGILPCIEVERDVSVEEIGALTARQRDRLDDLAVDEYV